MTERVDDGVPTTTSLAGSELAALRRSFNQLESQGTIAALLFYQKLFQLDPSLKPMFHSSIELQGRKLMDALAQTVATLEHPDKLRPVLMAMGRRHVSYGVQNAHYETVAEALMQTLAESLGPHFTPEVKRAWESALTYVSTEMQRGAAEGTGSAVVRRAPR